MYGGTERRKTKTLAAPGYLSMLKTKVFVNILQETKLKTASIIYGNPTEIPMIRKNQFRVLRSLKLEGNG